MQDQRLRKEKRGRILEGLDSTLLENLMSVIAVAVTGYALMVRECQRGVGHRPTNARVVQLAH